MIEIVEIWDVMNFQQGLIKSTECDFLLLNYPTWLKGTRRLVAFEFGVTVLGFRKCFLEVTQSVILLKQIMGSLKWRTILVHKVNGILDSTKHKV